MSERSCPACGEAASGRFCSGCGATLGGVACAECGNTLPEGGRYCNMCGTSAARPRTAEPAEAARPGGAPGWVPWAVAGVAVAALAVVLVGSPFGGDEPATNAPPPVASAAPAAGGAGGAAAVDLSSMTPREAADRLFNRVMTAVSSGDSAQARTFAPMAVGAYQRVPELDLDGRYHLAVLQLVNGEPEAALEQTALIRQAEPNHLLALFTAGEAQRALGDEAAARDLFQRFLDAYEAEITRPLPEYQDHARILPIQREQARGFVE